MLSERALTRALERAGLRAPVRFEEVTPSTQTLALEMARDGSPEWSLVAAAHQTEGRGRLGRTWVDEPGRALLFSLVLRPQIAPERGGLVSLLAGVALVDACAESADAPVACRWPNDVLVGDAKTAGILAESSVAAGTLEHVVLGIGVNLRAPPRVGGAAAVDADPAELLEAFLLAVASRYDPGGAAFATDVVSAYRARCATLGRRVRATTTDGSVVVGEAIEVDDAGGLVVRATDGERLVRFGEVVHLEPGGRRDGGAGGVE
jgi:BirA family biotin operon repressor/biotin-[acetyl-CoA-carboxylase] ligase